MIFSKLAYLLLARVRRVGVDISLGGGRGGGMRGSKEEEQNHRPDHGKALILADPVDR